MSTVAYVVGAYRHKSWRTMAANAEAAVEAGVKLTKRGYVALIPHRAIGCMYGKISEAEAMTACYELIRRSDCVVVLPSWNQSRMSPKEIDFARANKIPVWFGVENVPELSSNP